MKGFIECFEDSDETNVLVNIKSIVKVQPYNGGTLLLLTVQNAKNMPYMVSTTATYDEVKALIEAAS